MTSTAPVQYALNTRAGSEAVIRALWAVTEADPQTTVLSIDGVGAYDHISRASVLSAFQRRPDLAGILPFEAMFYGRANSYFF